MLSAVVVSRTTHVCSTAVVNSKLLKETKKSYGNLPIFLQTQLRNILCLHLHAILKHQWIL